MTDGPSVELWAIEKGGGSKIDSAPEELEFNKLFLFHLKNIRVVKALDLICNKYGRNALKSTENETNISFTITEAEAQTTSGYE